MTEELEPVGYILDRGEDLERITGDIDWATEQEREAEEPVFAASDIIELIDNLLSEIDEERFDSPKGAESVLLQLKSEIQSLEVERSDD